MAMADEGYVLPTPGTPKTLGILSVIFGVLMVLYGLCTGGFLVAAKPLMQLAETQVKQAQAQVENQRKEQQKTFDDREKAATTDEEKAAIRKERDAAAASQPPVVKVDMSAATQVLDDPVVMGYSYLQLGSGILLSVLLLVSGIGLIRLAPWGRSLSVAWAGLQILQLVVLTAANVLYVQPIQQANSEKMMAKMEADAKGPNAAPGAAEGVAMARAMNSSGASTILVLGYLVLGSIYPIILLILLNKPAVRAALIGAKPEGPAEF